MFKFADVSCASNSQRHELASSYDGKKFGLPKTNLKISHFKGKKLGLQKIYR